MVDFTQLDYLVGEQSHALLGGELGWYYGQVNGTIETTAIIDREVNVLDSNGALQRVTRAAFLLSDVRRVKKGDRFKTKTETWVVTDIEYSDAIETLAYVRLE